MPIEWKRLRRPRHPDPLTGALVAMFCAVVLVLYLEHSAVVGLRGRTAAVLRRISAHTAESVAESLRATLAGPVFDTLAAVNHPQIRENRLDLLHAAFVRGLADYPQVERFFVWTEQTETQVPGEALFCGTGDRVSGPPVPADVPAGFARDPVLGRRILALARRAAPAQQVYAAYNLTGANAGRVAFLRLFWTNARRDHYFAVTGYVVDRPRVRRVLLPTLYQRRLAALLQVQGHAPFELRVTDENGERLWGPASSLPSSARASLPIVFYPSEAIASRLAAKLEPVNWTLEVGPSRDDELAMAGLASYGLSGVLIGLMVMAFVITIKTGRRASETARMQADFVAHVSHQLKTPLSLLSAATETLVLDRVRSPEKLSRYIETIHSEVGRLSALVQRILELSRVQQRQPLALEEVDLSLLARETLEAFSRNLLERDLSFHFVQDGRAPLVIADPAAIEQALANLLDNAVKYSGTGKAITVRVGWQGNDAVIEVIDQGIGIPPSDRTRVFEKFYRSAGAMHERHGFGLGLAIVRELVTAHHGRVQVESTLHAGSTFRIVLPVASRLRRRGSRAALEVSR